MDKRKNLASLGKGKSQSSPGKVALMRLILYARTEAKEIGETDVAAMLQQAAVELLDSKQRQEIASRLREVETELDTILLSFVEGNDGASL